MVRENATDFLLELLQAHGFACKLRDEFAHRFGRRAETQVAQQVEQLFEHSTPTEQPKIRWPRRIVAVAALSIL
jgi:hypothetical protein